MFSFKKSTAIITALAITTLSVSSVFAAQTGTQNVNITTTVNDVLTFTVDTSTVALGNITPGTPVTGTVVAQVTTNAQAGFVLAAKKTDADTTLDKADDAAVNITDKTAWSSTVPNSALWATTGLGFRVLSAGTTATNRSAVWWGADDAVGNALFAGFPTAYETIHNANAFASTQQDVAVGIKLDVPATQKTGIYDGTIDLRVQTNI